MLGPRTAEIPAASYAPLRAITAGHGEPLLLLPGFGLTPLTYQRTIDALAERHRVIAPWLNLERCAWTFDGLVESVAEALDAAASRPAVIVGHSFGGAVALALAASHPELVGALIVVDCLGLTSEHAAIARRALRAGHLRRYATVGVTRDLFNCVLSGPRQLAASALWAYRCDLSEACRAVVDADLPRAVLWAHDDSLLPTRLGRLTARELDAPYLEVVPADGDRPIDHDWPYRHPTRFADELSAALIEARSRPRRTGT